MMLRSGTGTFSTPLTAFEDFKRVLKPTGNIFAFTSYNLLGKWHEAFDLAFDTFQFMGTAQDQPAAEAPKSRFSQ